MNDLKTLDNVNLNHFRVFECVFRTGSMTLAAQELHLTQSGVSQHMRSLEDMLGTRLFDRIKQRLVPTASARILHGHCARGLGEINAGVTLVRGEGKEAGSLKGSVTVGLPIEFGNNLVVPLLSEFSRKHPLVKFKLRLGFASAMNEEIMKGAMDFAFIDDFRMDSGISVEGIYDEELELCIAEPLAHRLAAAKTLKQTAARDQAKFFSGLDYVEYAEEEPMLRKWFSHHLGPKIGRSLQLNVRATVMDVQGVARFITSEAGAGILPGYLVSQLIRSGQPIYRFQGCGRPVVNRISLAGLRDRTHSPAARAAMDFLKTSLV